MTRRLSAAVAALSTLALGACGGQESSAKPSTTVAPFSQDDVDFAVAMSSHRGQAFGLAELAGSRVADPAVRRIVARIRGTDAAAVDRIAEWLAEWERAGIGVPHDHSQDDVTKPGMLSQVEVDRVARTSARRFDRALLVALIAHHRAGIPLMQRQLQVGRSERARAMASELAQLYRSELAVMERAVDKAK